MADAKLDEQIEPHIWTECPLCMDIIMSHDKVETVEAHGRMHLAHTDCVERACADREEEDDE